MHIVEAAPGEEKKIEKIHSEAKTAIKWEDRPDWLQEKNISQLSYFISDDQLRSDILAVGPEHFDDGVSTQEATDDNINTYIQEAQALASTFILDYDKSRENENAYHNYEHTRQVIERAAKMIQLSQPRLSAQEARAMIVAAAFHDYDHPAQDDFVHPEGTSNEQHSANTMLEYMRKQGFTLRQQTEAYNMIIGTSFWDKANVFPLNRQERLFKFADLGGFMQEDYNGLVLEDTEITNWTPRMQAMADWMEQSINVAAEHAKKPTERIPPYIMDWLTPSKDEAIAQSDWLKGQFYFVEYDIKPLTRSMNDNGDIPDVSSFLQNANEKRNMIFKLRGHYDDVFDLEKARQRDSSETVEIDLTADEQLQLGIIVDKIVWPKFRQIREAYAERVAAANGTK